MLYLQYQTNEEQVTCECLRICLFFLFIHITNINMRMRDLFYIEIFQHLA